ncbi:class I SAM-dependent methyltransferase [Mariprofundus sp. NF]|uniref:class I SAM-dependent methyltransferase n=1 Tax=Mariprofundus sp. NF TaxID=2608716 RepID=UPI0015A4524B|nr:class I SAM-dependent methyltransferase [Mariprofundus sp. NF]NWF39499.1 class I SAM-dependent methyltransferase [Mariprofundus sp. NF]
MGHRKEVESGDRFEFGANWALFLKELNEDRILMAVDSLKRMLDVETLEGKTFLDIGSGSGLFSLAARQLGAKVHSIDFDPQSVACTRKLRERFFANDSQWVVEEGSVLDENHLRGLGQYDVVYSWGVLHHTGKMWQALENAGSMVSGGGTLFVSIYNDQGGISRRWLLAKRAYNSLPKGFRWLVWLPSLLKVWGPQVIRDVINQGNPFHSWIHYAESGARGMSAFRDLIDWVGGLPFEVAKPEEIFAFYHERGFMLERMITCGGGLGCNEFVFTNKSDKF